MSIKSLIATVLEMIIKVVILTVVGIFVFRYAMQAYDFGYRVFADEPVSIAGGRTITVGIAKSASVKDIGELLEEKGLIEDAKLFVVQELLSAHHGDIIPGIYDLSTDMTTAQMLEIMSTPASEEEETVQEENGMEESDNLGEQAQ